MKRFMQNIKVFEGTCEDDVRTDRRGNRDATDEGCGASLGQWVYPLVLHRWADFLFNAAGTSLKKQGVSVNYHSINVWFGSTLVF